MRNNYEIESKETKKISSTPLISFKYFTEQYNLVVNFFRGPKKYFDHVLFSLKTIRSLTSFTLL
jgi:hypothetical protein